MKPAVSIFNLVAALAAGIGRDYPITLALVFTRVAAAGDSGVLQATVARELDLSPAVLTRSVQTLSHLHFSKQRNGLGLIERTIDGPDGRHKTLRLTEKGEALAAVLSRAV
jgi:DNA-binding MarR family transcriptional regulator